MANQHGSVWTRHPKLHAVAARLVADGTEGKALERAVREEASLSLTSDAIRKHLTRCSGECAAAVVTPLERLTEPEGGFAVDSVPPKPEHPKGWEPHVEENGNTATAVSQPLETANPDEEELIRGWNLDPKLWRIVGPLNCRRWQAVVPVKADGKTVGYESRWLYYYKANLERVDPIRESEIAGLIDEIRSHVFVPGPYPEGDDAFAIFIADPQMGKSDGDGVEGTTRRILDRIDTGERRILELRKAGRPLRELHVMGMGDLIESCDGHYPQQTFRTTLNLRDQVKVMRRLVVKALEKWSPLFDRVVVSAVGGNHGEVRRDGKSFTDFADNHDVAIFEQVQEILSANPAAYGHVEFRIPNDGLVLVQDIAGTYTATTHGQVFGKGGGEPAKKAQTWWMRQAHGEQPAGAATLLISAHYHHLIVNQSGSKTHIQCPALEGGSDWFRNQTGADSWPGMLSLRIGKSVSPFGWGDLEVL